MNRDEILEGLQEAQEIADALNERYQVAAFQALAQRFLASTSPVISGLRQDGATSANDGVPLPATINELLTLFRRKSHYDRFEAIAWYYLKKDGIDGITTDEILAAYSTAREKKPVNAADVVMTCIRKGHLVEGDRRGDQKTLRLLGSGEENIERLLSQLLG